MCGAKTTAFGRNRAQDAGSGQDTDARAAPEDETVRRSSLPYTAVVILSP